MARNLSAVVAGHICLDIIPQIGGSADDFRASFQPGHLTVVGPALFGTGGAASNTGLAMHRLGIDVRIMGKVGDDFIGELIRQILVRSGRGPAAGMIIDQAVHSSYTVVISPPDIDRSFLHYPGANDTFSAERRALQRGRRRQPVPLRLSAADGAHVRGRRRGARRDVPPGKGDGRHDLARHGRARP